LFVVGLLAIVQLIRLLQRLTGLLQRIGRFLAVSLLHGLVRGLERIGEVLQLLLVGGIHAIEVLLRLLHRLLELFGSEFPFVAQSLQLLFGLRGVGGLLSCSFMS